MRLRTQLGLFFTVMAGIVLALGGLTVWGGTRVLRTFSDSLDSMERVSRIRSLQVLLTRQKASLDAFFLLGEPRELERFDELSGIVTSRFVEIENFSPADQTFRDLNHQYKTVLASAQSVIDLYRRDKTKAFALATEDLLPKVGRLFEDVNRVEERLGEDVREGRIRIKDLVVKGGRIVMAFGLLGALAGFFFALGTFRSLTRSLRVLQAGAAAFGSGQWDHRIHLPTRDEMGELARSFNEMANNIKQLEMQTVHMHRMSAVGQLAGGVAHEINNPLTGVLGQAQILLDKMAAEDPRRSHIEKIERAAVRCKRIVRSLLDFSRQKETQFTDVNLNETVEATLELCEPDLQNNRVAVLKDLSVSVPPISGHAAQLQQVFLNLVTNAIQAMPQGGTLTISSQAGFFQLPAGAEGKRTEAVEIRFADTGVGIASEHLNHLFEPFFTTKEIGKGTGLGLSVSLGIVRNHGGDIQVESAGLGRGATFRVLLPVSSEAAASRPQTTPAARPSAADAVPSTRFGPGTSSRY